MTNDRNLDEKDVNAAIRDLVREPEDLAGDGLAKALAEVATTPQVRTRRRWWHFGRNPGSAPAQPGTTSVPEPARISPIARLVAAVALVAVVAFFIGTLDPFDSAVLTPATSPSPSLTDEPSPQPSAEPTAPATVAPDGRPSPPPVLLDPPTSIVDGTGAGDHLTIAEGVAVAIDGDIIGIAPGTYDESVLVDKDIEIRGLGEDRSQVLVRITPASARLPVEVPEDAEDFEPGEIGSAYAFRLVGSDASINGLTIESLVEDGTGVAVEGGDPELSDLAFTRDAQTDGTFVLADGGAAGTLRDSISNGDLTFSGGASTLVTGVTLSPSLGGSAPVTWIDGRGTAVRLMANQLSSVVFEGGSATIEGNDISGIDARFDAGVTAFDGADTTATIRGNLIHDWSGSGVDVGGLFVIDGNTFRANTAAVTVGPGASATVTGNTIEGSRGPGISSQAGSRVNIVGNDLSSNDVGIETTTDGGGDDLVPLGSPVLGIVDDNTLTDNTTAMDLAGSGQIISNNVITGGSNGIIVRDPGSPTLDGNSVSDTTGDGILVQAGSSPRVIGNSLCGNTRNMFIEDGTEADVLDNEPCAADAAAGNAGLPSIVAGVAPSDCAPELSCLLRGSGGFSALGPRRTTRLALANGSWYGGVGEPFRLLLRNKANAMTVDGIAEVGTYRGDPRFSLVMNGPTIQTDVDTDAGSDCVIVIERANKARVAGTVTCEQHPTDLDDPVDIEGEFSARATARGGASAWRATFAMRGYAGEMLTYDSDLLFEGHLDAMASAFSDEAFELHYVDSDDSTLTITGRTTPGSYTGDGDGFSLLFDSAESLMLRTDSARTRCQIDLERADAGGIEGAWSCLILGQTAGGWFSALP